MDNQILFQKVISTINTLNQIEVKGKSNVSFVLGCIQTLESILEEINQEEDQKEK